MERQQLHLIYRFDTVAGHIHGTTVLLQHRRYHLLVDGIVIHHQYPAVGIVFTDHRCDAGFRDVHQRMPGDEVEVSIFS